MFSKLCRCSQMFNRFSVLKLLKGANFSSKPIGIIGAPFCKGQPKHGVDLAPDVLRNYGLLKQLQDLGLDIKDFGNVKFDTDFDANFGNASEKPKYPREVGAACQKVSEAVKYVLSEGRKCVTIGGDHSLSIGTVYGHSLVNKICVLWIDAHADINTPCTSPSGNMHGMSLAFLIKELKKYQSSTEGFEWLTPCVSKANVAFIGLRDIDPLEKLILTKENILHFSMREIDELGVFEVTKRALTAINPLGELSLHVSFDVDSIDTLMTPCTGTPVLGGLTTREALCIAEEISNLDYFQALDIVEVNPALGNHEQIANTLGVTTLITKAFLGFARKGYVPSDVYEIPIV